MEKQKGKKKNLQITSFEGSGSPQEKPKGTNFQGTRVAPASKCISLPSSGVRARKVSPYTTQANTPSGNLKSTLSQNLADEKPSQTGDRASKTEHPKPKGTKILHHMLSQISTVSNPPGNALCFLSPLSRMSELCLNGLGSCSLL